MDTARASLGLADVRRLTWRAVLARRLARHYLIRPAGRGRIAEVVGALCGIHAQVMPSAELSLGLRIAGITAREVRDALWERRELVKTYGVRGTVHLFPAAELALWNAALGAVETVDPRRLKFFGLTETQTRKVAEAIGAAVAGRCLTREELGAEVARRVGRWATERTVSAFGGQWAAWQIGIDAAARQGLVCWGPPSGIRVTFVSPRDWLGRQQKVDAGTALREVVRRYLAAYGPATSLQLAQWLATGAAVARDALASLGTELEEVDVEGMRAWQIAGDSVPRTMKPSVLLLPRFDVYAVGSHPRDVIAPPPVVAGAGTTGLFTRGRGSARQYLVGPTPVLVIDGAVAGIWESKRSRTEVAVRVQPFVRLSVTQRDLIAACAERIASVWAARASLRFGAATTRPHL
jgi:hypothetical protein